MKKIFSIMIFMCFFLCSQAMAVDWVQINDTWYVDLDSFERKGETVSLWSKDNVSK